MVSLRWSPLVVLVTALLACGCTGSSDAGNAKPASSTAASAAPSAAAVVSIPGVDLSPLTAREQREWSEQVQTLLAPCAETPVSVSQCISEKRACKACMPAALFLLDSVRAGRSKQDREKAYSMRFDAKKVRSIDADGCPELGPPDAPVTIIEWADFECPACKAFYPILDGLVKRFPGQVRLVYKNYPLSIHPHGELAARAAVAASRQNKFWEMHHLLFDNQERLEQTDLEGYAKQLKLDVGKFKSDMGSDDTIARITRDKRAADDVNLDSTPTVFINGREVDMQLLDDPVNDLVKWVKLDLELAGVTPAPAPATSASAEPPVPAASASAGPAPSAAAVPSAGLPKK
jgi:protein-disulfide isomerase